MLLVNVAVKFLNHLMTYVMLCELKCEICCLVKSAGGRNY